MPILGMADARNPTRDVATTPVRTPIRTSHWRIQRYWRLECGDELRGTIRKSSADSSVFPWASIALCRLASPMLPFRQALQCTVRWVGSA